MLIILSLVIVSLVIVSMVTLSLHCLSNHCNANHCLSSHCLSGHCLSGHSLSWLSLSSHCLVSTRTILSCPAICVYSHYLILPSLVILSIVLCLHALSYLALHSLSPSSLSLVSTRTISSCPAIFLFAWSVYSLVSSLCILCVYFRVLHCVAVFQCACIGRQSVYSIYSAVWKKAARYYILLHYYLLITYSRTVYLFYVFSSLNAHRRFLAAVFFCLSFSTHANIGGQWQCVSFLLSSHFLCTHTHVQSAIYLFRNLNRPRQNSQDFFIVSPYHTLCVPSVCVCAHKHLCM